LMWTRGVNCRRLADSRRRPMSHYLYARLLVHVRSPTWTRNAGCAVASACTAIRRFRAVVVRVDFVPALQTSELFAIAVILVSKPTVGVQTSLAGVIGVNLLNRDTSFWSLYSIYSTRRRNTHI